MPLAYDPPGPAFAELLLRSLEKRMVSAERRGSLSVAARLAGEASSLLKKLSDVPGAASFAERAMDYVDIASATSVPVPSSIAVQAHRKSSLNHLSLGNIELAHSLMLKAQLLVDDTVPPEVTANVHWSSSVLADRLHDPISALDHALRAWAYYRDHGQSLERSRLSIEIAQHAMDLAQLACSSGAFTSEYEYLALAHEHILAAQPRSRSIYASEVELKLLITYTRFSRLTNRLDDRLSLLEDIERRAIYRNFPVIQGLALAAAADELRALGHFDASRIRHHQAIDVLSKSSFRDMALPIKRALMLDEEFRIR